MAFSGLIISARGIIFSTLEVTPGFWTFYQKHCDRKSFVVASDKKTMRHSDSHKI